MGCRVWLLGRSMLAYEVYVNEVHLPRHNRVVNKAVTVRHVIVGIHQLLYLIRPNQIRTLVNPLYPFFSFLSAHRCLTSDVFHF